MTAPIRATLVFTAVATVSLLAHDAIRAQQAPAGAEVLTNEAVVQMIVGKVPKALVLAKIHSTPNAFVITPQALVGLYQGRLPTDVIKAMLVSPSEEAKKEVLTNAGVVHMVEGKLPTDIILTKIKITTPGYNLTATGLVGLQQSRVSANIVKAMMAATAAMTPTSSAEPAATTKPATATTSAPAGTKPAAAPATAVPVAAARTPVQAAASASAATASARQPVGLKVNWERDLQTRIAQRYPMARLSFDSRNVRTPGTVLLLLQPNVLAETRVFRNTIRNGVLQAPGASGFMSDLVRQAEDNDATRDRVSLPLYQPVFLTAVRVSADAISLDVATRRQFIQESVDRAAIARFVDGTSLKGDTLTKTDVTVRQASLFFEFPKGSVRDMTFDEVIAAIDAMVVRADDPKAPQFGKVALGMTRQQVITNLGKPKNVVSLDNKEVLVFNELKVTLVNGAVTNVE